jgi:hypothetical protein
MMVVIIFLGVNPVVVGPDQLDPNFAQLLSSCRVGRKEKEGENREWQYRSVGT